MVITVPLAIASVLLPLGTYSLVKYYNPKFSIRSLFAYIGGLLTGRSNMPPKTQTPWPEHKPVGTRKRSDSVSEEPKPEADSELAGAANSASESEESEKSAAADASLLADMLGDMTIGNGSEPVPSAAIRSPSADQALKPAVLLPQPSSPSPAGGLFDKMAASPSARSRKTRNGRTVTNTLQDTSKVLESEAGNPGVRS